MRCWLLALLMVAGVVDAKPRARELGIPFDGTPGSYNAITDVGGVTVGFSTLIAEIDGRSARTGVTAIVPRGERSRDWPVFAGVFALNGNGEMTGSQFVEETGFLEGPVMLTNSHSVGVVHDAVIEWRVRLGKPDASGYFWTTPVVAETWDGDLNDINAFFVKPAHVFAALENAHGGAVAEGNVGGGTGMICHEFKGGTGTSSRRVRVDDAEYTVGVLVQANHGERKELRIAGIPVGAEMQQGKLKPESKDQGSIIIVIATDAPLLPHQLKRLARRASLGLGRTGSYASNGSGDIFIAFSTANPQANQVQMKALDAVANESIDPLFLATVQAVEESIINALVAAETMTGTEGHRAVAIDTRELRKILRHHRQLVSPQAASPTTDKTAAYPSTHGR